MKTLKTFIAVITSFSLIMLPGCDDFAYKGKDTDLFSVVTNSVFGISSEFPGKTVVLDKDSNGRTLFVYWGNMIIANDRPGVYNKGYVILVSQKTENGYVYYYPDYNFLLYHEDPSWKGRTPTNDELIQYAKDLDIEDKIEWLKSKNDWEKPLNESKYVKVKVSKKDRERDSGGTLVPFEIQKEAYRKILNNHEATIDGLYYLTSDQYDRHLYFFRSIEGNVYTKSFVIIFNKDGSYDIDKGVMEITDVWNYQDELKVFKERNNWNKPPS